MSDQPRCKCWMCGKRRAWGAGFWCDPCNRSYARGRVRGNGTVIATIRWAVNRALRERGVRP
jgi:hypothetical protein